MVGAMLLVAGTMLHPMAADPGDSVAAFSEYAAADGWIASHVGQFFGVALAFVGLVALADTLRDEASAWLARLGVYVAVAAFAAAAILQAVDGVALKAMVDAWANAPADQKQSTYLAALAVRHIEIGIASLAAILFGAAILLFAFGIAMGASYPSWVGWLGVAAGVGTVAGGLLTAFTGFSTAAMKVAMPFNIMIVAWMVLVGVLMWRRS
jgi:hypothetical protein